MTATTSPPSTDPTTLQLSADEFSLFRHTGYRRLRRQLPALLVETMREVVEAEIAAGRPPYRLDHDGRVRRIDALVDRHPVFLDALQAPEIATPLQGLLGPNVFLVRNRHNHATTNRSEGPSYRLHRDILQWSRPVVTAIIYLEEATVDNGCTHVVPGSHLAPFAGMPPDGGGGNWADDHADYDYVHAQALPVPMPAGGVLIFDSLMFHTVGANHTDGTRLSVSFAFHSVDETDDSPQDKRILLYGERVYKGNDLYHQHTRTSPGSSR